ncbi:hypothetical protein F4778DRAFT_544925 [Xylariomycetidae sp. FL2044]|nr:hypothetical protein F4778DRAFT_544925 [Xylariomycetidae sp. FL2044]
MPRHGLGSGPRLGIELEDFKYCYMPGDTLIGSVNRTLPVQGDCIVKVTFFGRVKTKIDRKTTESHSIWRGRASLFSETITLHRGEINGSARFPFVFIIPQTTAPGIERRGDAFGSEWRFLSTAGDVSQHRLPPVYYFSRERRLSTKAEAYIEYVLEAELLRSHKVEETATFPLFIRAPSTEKPIADHGIQTQQSIIKIRTPKLLKEFADSKLTFRQKSSRLFRPSKTPRFGFSVYVKFPTVMQLEHPDPIPISVYLVVDPSRTSPEVLDDLPPVELLYVSKSKLQSTSRVRAPGTLGDHDCERIDDYPLRFQRLFDPVTIPVRPTATVHGQVGSLQGQSSLPPDSKSVSFPLGAALQVFLTNKKPKNMQGASAPEALHPSLKTYNISVAYQLKWEFQIRCAGEIESVSGQANVTVLPPCEELQERHMQALGPEGMKKNYDDMLAAAGTGLAGLAATLGLIEAIGNL